MSEQLMGMTREEILSQAQSVLDGITLEMIISRAVQNMADEFDYPDEREIIQTAARLVIDQLSSVAGLPASAVNLSAPPF